MNRRGRKTKPRTSELGLCIEKFREGHGWSIRYLAEKAGISYKTLSKIELARTLPRKPYILQKLAKVLDVHPDKLLVPASLTPMLRPAIVGASSLTPRQPLTLLVNENERHQLESYLNYLRYVALVESLNEDIDTELEFTNQR